MHPIREQTPSSLRITFIWVRCIPQITRKLPDLSSNQGKVGLATTITASQQSRFKSNQNHGTRGPQAISVRSHSLGSLVWDISAPGSAAAVKCTLGTLPCHRTSSRLHPSDGNTLPLSKPLFEAQKYDTGKVSSVC